MGCAATFKVWVWYRGARANRVVMALCSIRLFFSSGGSSSDAANKRTGFKQMGLNGVSPIADKEKTNKHGEPAPFCLFSLSCLLRAETSACSVSTRRSLSSTLWQAFCTQGNGNPEGRRWTELQPQTASSDRSPPAPTAASHSFCWLRRPLSEAHSRRRSWSCE